MTLKEHIDGIRYNLKTGLYPNKAAVSQGIMLRLLEALDWPTDNPQVILTEYSVEEQRVSFAEKQRVDFALCHPPSEPIVFIEVKQVGYFERAGAKRLENEQKNNCLNMLFAEKFQSQSSPMGRNGVFSIQSDKEITENGRYTKWI